MTATRVKTTIPGSCRFAKNNPDLGDTEQSQSMTGNRISLRVDQSVASLGFASGHSGEATLFSREWPDGINC